MTGNARDRSMDRPMDGSVRSCRLRGSRMAARSSTKSGICGVLSAGGRSRGKAALRANVLMAAGIGTGGLQAVRLVAGDTVEVHMSTSAHLDQSIVIFLICMTLDAKIGTAFDLFVPLCSLVPK